MMHLQQFSWPIHKCLCTCAHMSADGQVNEDIKFPCVFLYEWVHVHDGLTLPEQLLALCGNPKAMKSYFMTIYQGLWGWGWGTWFWPEDFYRKTVVYSSCLFSGWRQQ